MIGTRYNVTHKMHLPHHTRSSVASISWHPLVPFLHGSLFLSPNSLNSALRRTCVAKTVVCRTSLYAEMQHLACLLTCNRLWLESVHLTTRASQRVRATKLVSSNQSGSKHFTKTSSSKYYIPFCCRGFFFFMKYQFFKTRFYLGFFFHRTPPPSFVYCLEFQASE